MQSTSWITAILAITLLPVLTACSGHAPRPTVKDNPISADPQLIEFVKSKGWLEQNCRLTLRYENKTNLEKCLRVQAALMEPYDPDRPDQFGKDYDPERYYKCRNKLGRSSLGGCEKYQLVRNEPEPVWPNPEIPPIKWPAPPKEQVYYPGISPKDYFFGLCRAESGNFIYKTVDNVEGVYQIRPRYQKSEWERYDPYVIEDPFGYKDFEAREPGQWVLAQGYNFVETSLYNPLYNPKLAHKKRYYDESLFELPRPGMRFLRYVRKSLDSKASLRRNLKMLQGPELKSRYGYIWRGIKRPKDREMGIAGGELAIVDLQTNEILALRRGFVWSGVGRDGGVSWLTANRCVYDKKHKFHNFSYFIAEVLKPAPLELDSEGAD